MLQKYAQDLKKEFAGYNAKGLLSDVMAGLTVAAVALPLALAFGVSSGASAASGLLTAIVAGAIIALLGGAFYQISGPTGAMAAILTSVVAQYGLNGVFQATFLAGILLVIAGLFKLGRLTAFIPMPVITGFTSGIAVIIALGQVDNFFGVTSIEGSAIQKVGGYFTHGFDPNWTAVAIGFFVVLFMVFFPKKWNSVVPASLVAIILATAASMLLKLPVNTVGEIPSSLMLPQRLDLLSLDLNTLSGLLAPAISIAALGMVESLLCGASASRMTGVKLDNDRELLAQGIGNILTPLFGGSPACGHCPYQCGGEIRRPHPAHRCVPRSFPADLHAGPGAGDGTDSSVRFGRSADGHRLADERVEDHPLYFLQKIQRRYSEIPGDHGRHHPL